MGRVKIKKKDTFIDMTPMSDVMVLLLTFFMLTSTFTKREPVKVFTPASVSEIKVPDKNVLSILVDKSGKVFMSIDNHNDMNSILTSMTEQYSVQLTAEETKKFLNEPVFGVPMNNLKQYLDMPDNERNNALKEMGIPCDSVKQSASEFENWVKWARQANPAILISIKADAATPYSTIKKVMSSLQDIRENRYYLITSLKKLDKD